MCARHVKYIPKFKISIKITRVRCKLIFVVSTVVEFNLQIPNQIDAQPITYLRSMLFTVILFNELVNWLNWHLDIFITDANYFRCYIAFGDISSIFNAFEDVAQPCNSNLILNVSLEFACKPTMKWIKTSDIWGC